MEFFICYQIKVRYMFLSNFIPNQHELHNSHRIYSVLKEEGFSQH